MLRIVILSILSLTIFAGVWFYQKITTPQLNSQIKVHNLPWQIGIVSPDISHVLELDLGSATLGDAISVYGNEFKLAWFEHSDEQERTTNITLEAYFSRVSLSGLRAKIILELEYNQQEISLEYLRKNSGEPKVLVSHAIKYPLDDLANKMRKQKIKSLTYVPIISIPVDIIESRFGAAAEKVIISDLVQFWMYPQKGLVIMFDKKGKEAFQYIPISDYQRLEKKVRLNQTHTSIKN
ncbi:MAG: hypothetical protein HQL46_06505 [Gammaproteobacteria bacterium]|nr:hypothetical protein [Gammaproteobacteria bacterium]